MKEVGHATPAYPTGLVKGGTGSGEQWRPGAVKLPGGQSSAVGGAIAGSSAL